MKPLWLSVALAAIVTTSPLWYPHRTPYVTALAVNDCMTDALTAPAHFAARWGYPEPLGACLAARSPKVWVFGL